MKRIYRESLCRNCDHRVSGVDPKGGVLLNTRGRPWKNISFGYWLAARCEEAGAPGSAHGLRKAGATISANNGATPFELTAMYGWSSTKIAEIYKRKADKARLAERAGNKLYPHQEKGAGGNASATS